MKHVLVTAALLVAVCFFTHFAVAQETNVLEGLHGDFQWDAAYYGQDSVIGTPEYPEKIGSNAYLQLLYDRAGFSAGLRFESYQPALQGFDRRYNQSAIPYRFIRYRTEKIDVTVGNIYEQFGTGLIFRAYQDWNLGFDNSLDGIRGIFTPLPALRIKAMVGRQRFYFDKGPGLVRAADAELDFGLVPNLDSTLLSGLRVGVAAVSKFQKDEDPTLRLPENVASVSPRITYVRGLTNFTVEYAYKVNDPSAVNAQIYRPGQALIGLLSHASANYGFTLGAKRIDNMDFRSDRNASLNDLLIGFLPALTPPLTYRLTTLYPYATQPRGEMGLQGDFFYRFYPETPLGGSSGLYFQANYARIHGLDEVPTGDLRGYTSDFFTPGKTLYYENLNLEVQKKLSGKVKVTAGYYYIVANNNIVRVTDFEGTIFSHTGVVDLLWKIRPKRSLRIEAQALFTKQDRGNWAMLLAEYSVAPHWFFAVSNELNYQNPKTDKPINYFFGTIGYLSGPYRFTVGYGRQRAGVFCVGGVCRTVPASNGLSVSISGSF